MCTFLIGVWWINNLYNRTSDGFGGDRGMYWTYYSRNLLAYPLLTIGWKRRECCLIDICKIRKYLFCNKTFNSGLLMYYKLEFILTIIIKLLFISVAPNHVLVYCGRKFQRPTHILIHNYLCAIWYNTIDIWNFNVFL